MTPARRRGGSPAAPRRLVQLLDIDGEDVPCVNYKKLLREQSGETRASAEKEAKQKSATATASEAAMKSPKSLLESGGAGGGGAHGGGDSKNRGAVSRWTGERVER